MISFSKILKYSLALVVSAVLILGISLSQRKIDTMIKKHDLFFTGQINNAPPMVAFTTMALGSFRGLIADLLWLRAASLQEDKNYYEMVQLASWITKLQPRFASATAYLAWNMAYNISVTCSLWEDRWYWVWEGIKLIRDEALLYNPDDQKLYWELAVIFQQKMGNVLDNASYYYKTRLAEEMQAVIGENPDWNLLSAQPKTKQEFAARYPEGHPIWRAIHRAGYENFDRFFNDFKANHGFKPGLGEALGKDAVQVDAALRTIWLNEKYRLDASIIRDLNNKYGDMDWRLPEAQALYWASEGIRRTGRHNMQCSRIIATCLQEMTRAGRVLWTKRDDYNMLLMAPNLALIKSACATYDWARQEADNLDSFRTGKINYMKNGIMFLHRYRYYKDAKEVFEMLKKDDYTVKYTTIEDMVAKELSETLEIATAKQITTIIESYLENGFEALVDDDLEAARSCEVTAKKIYVQYQSGITSDKEKGRRGLADFNSILRETRANYLKKIANNPRKKAVFEAKMASQKAADDAAKAEEKENK